MIKVRFAATRGAIRGRLTPKTTAPKVSYLLPGDESALSLPLNPIPTTQRRTQPQRSRHNYSNALVLLPASNFPSSIRRPTGRDRLEPGQVFPKLVSRAPKGFCGGSWGSTSFPRKQNGVEISPDDDSGFLLRDHGYRCYLFFPSRWKLLAARGRLVRRLVEVFQKVVSRALREGSERNLEDLGIAEEWRTGGSRLQRRLDEFSRNL